MVFKFCRPKCHNGFKKKKNPRKVKWTKSFRKTVGKELAVDPSFELEKRRNIPVKYNRELWQQTVDAIHRISDIRERREAKYITHRLNTSKYHDLCTAQTLVKKHMHLVRLPAADIKKTKVKVEEEVKMEDGVAEKIEAGPSKLAEKKKTKLAKKVSDDAEMIEEDYSVSDDDSDGDYNDDINMSDIEDEPNSLCEEVPVDSGQ